MHEYLTVDLSELLLEEKVDQERVDVIIGVAKTPVELWAILKFRYDSDIMRFVRHYFTDGSLIELAVILFFIFERVGLLTSKSVTGKLEEIIGDRLYNLDDQEQFAGLTVSGKDKIDTFPKLWANCLNGPKWFNESDFNIRDSIHTFIRERGITSRRIIKEVTLCGSFFLKNWFMMSPDEIKYQLGLGENDRLSSDPDYENQINNLILKHRQCLRNCFYDWIELYKFSRSIGEFMKDDPTYVERCYSIARYERDEYLTDEIPELSDFTDFIWDDYNFIVNGRNVIGPITLWGKWFESSDDVRHALKGERSHYIPLVEEIVSKVDAILKN